VVFISDLHALTLEHDPTEVRRRTLEFATLLLAAGANPDACLFLVQSHVPEHTELHYLLEGLTGYGEAQRMIQFKEKSRRQQQVRMSLLTYPILMAADILLYDTDEVPVGEDQRQHVDWPAMWRAGSTPATGAPSQCRGQSIRWLPHGSWT
jgi:tryptophanyl-tRNA synthetase